jgi:4-aminobutyrate aminotransferase
MLAFELVKDQQSRERAPQLRDRIVDLAFHRGILVLGAGQNSIRLSPPLVLSEDQADFALQTLEEAIAEAVA